MHGTNERGERVTDRATGMDALRAIEADIERLQAEAARQRAQLGLSPGTPASSEADQALAILQSVSEHAIVTTDLNGRITGWNSGAAANLGWSEQEALGQDAGALYFTAEDQAAGQPEREMTLARTRGHATDERWHRRKDGRFFAQGEMTPLLDTRGVHVGYVKVFRDRTGQRLAEDAARTAATELRELTDALPLLVAIVGPDHRYRFANRHYEAWFGVPRERLVGMHVRDLVGEDAYRARLAQLERALAGEAVEYEGFLPNRDGERRDCHIHYLPRRNASGDVDGIYVQVMDITERKRAEAARRRADERIRLALDSEAVLGTWIWDLAEDRFTSDARFARTFSLDPAVMERGVGIAEVMQSIHPDDKPRVEALIARAMRDGGAYRAEYRVRQLDGGYRWIEANGHITQDEAGRPLRFPGVLVNIHRRKTNERYQAALLQLGDRLRLLDEPAGIAAAAAAIAGRTMDLLRTGYGTTDPARSCIVVERDWCRGPDVVSTAGRHRFADYGSYIEDLKRGEVVAIADIAADPRTATDCDTFLKLGVRSLLNVPLMEEGGLTGVFFLHHDAPRVWGEEEIAFVRGVTDRTWAAMTRAEAAQALRRLNDTLKQRIDAAIAERDQLWHSSRDLIVITDRKGCVTLTNPAWNRDFGHPAGMTDRVPFTDFVHPDDRAVFRRLHATMGIGETVPNVEARMRTADGAERLIDWAVAALEGGFSATGRDVTEQRRVEEQLHQSQKMEAVGRLTGGMAHDFNNLLQAMSGCLHLVERRAGHVAGVQKVLDAGRQAVDRGASMIRQLMAFSRRQSLQPEAFDVRDRLLGMRVFLDRALRADIQLEFDLEAGLWPVMADRVQFELAVLNLATNSRDAIPAAGRVVIGAGNTVLTGEHGLHGAFVRVWVRDSGHGIAPEAIGRVFEPFFTTKVVGQGTGLGLAQVYGFCRQSGGTATVESRLGAGTVVTLLLPRAEAASAENEEAQRSIAGGGGARVLLVEDDPVVAPVITAALEDLGYRVARAVTGDDALRRLQAGEEADLLFSDVVMPGDVDGIALAQAAQRLLPDLAVVLTTGYSENQAGLEGLPVLSKPYRIEDLSAVFREALNRKGRPDS